MLQKGQKAPLDIVVLDTVSKPVALANYRGRWMGRAYMGTIRATFIVNPEGVITHVWEAVKPDNHGEEIVQVLHSFKLEKMS
ncbi:MAG: hypothetical protein Q8Q94_01405 [bacterium]|nr:hypothetical protein [bacterium]